MVASSELAHFFPSPTSGEGRVGFFLASSGGARGPATLPEVGEGFKRHIPIVLPRFSDTLSRKAVVESHFWSAPISRARSLVM
jgi:hypothetical protein